MLFYLLRQVLLAIPALFGVLASVFLLMRSVPGDVVNSLVGFQGTVSPERMEELRRLFGLDVPIHEQFGAWLWAALRGDLGSSLLTGRSVVGDLALRFPVTLELTLLSLLVALAIAIPLGVVAALRRGGPVDLAVSIFALLGLSIPGFFLGILLILLFSLRLDLLPPAGYVPLSEGLVENLRHMILPSVSLGVILAAAVTRIVRSTMLEVLGRDFVRTADHDFQATILGSSGQSDPDDYLYSPFVTGLGSNLGNYSFPELDALLEQGRQATTQEERRSIYAEAQQLLFEESPMVFLFHSAQYEALRTNIQGFEHFPNTSYLGLRTTWIE